jgi:neutral ceramidase
MRSIRTRFVAAALAMGLVGQVHASVATLRAGAARVDITPTASELPEGYDGVHDPLFARALAFDNGTTRAALITVDFGAIGEQVWKDVSAYATSALRVPAAQLLITATHTHSSGRQLSPRQIDGIREALRSAFDALQPAHVSHGVGESYINVNRNIIDP